MRKKSSQSYACKSKCKYLYILHLALHCIKALNIKEYFHLFKTEYQEDLNDGLQTSIPCPGCTQIFTNTAAYKIHFNSCVKGVYFNCLICDYPFTRKSTCDEHIDSHLDGQCFHCKICKTKYQTIGSLRNHAHEKHRTTLANLDPHTYREPKENILTETKERHEKCIENYIPQGGNTTATRHMNSPALVGSAFSHNARNLHPIKAKAIGEIKFLS